MSNGLIWGSNVLQMLQEIGNDGNVVAVIRHSERPDFDTLPSDKWENVGLTAKGTIVATDFGHKLSELQNTKSYKILGWGLKRCVDTAEAISAGARDGGCPITGLKSIVLKSPVANREAYYRALFSGKWDLWNKMIDDWLNNDTQQTIMIPARQYAREVYQSLFAEEFSSSDKITVIVTHDLHILPLARLLFPFTSRYLDFLNGIVLKVNGDQITVGFDGKFVVVNSKDMILY
jgi:broad specificity phosphatase PhoE